MYLYKFFILKYVIIKIFTIFENISETISRNFLIFRNTQVTKIDQRLKIGVSSRSILQRLFF